MKLIRGTQEMKVENCFSTLLILHIGYYGLGALDCNLKSYWEYCQTSPMEIY